MNSQDMILEMLVAKGAFVPGSFKLASGKTTDLKFEVTQVERDPTLLSVLAMGLVDRLENPGIIDTVVGVATGGTLLSRLVSRYLAHITNREEAAVRFIETHKLCGGGFAIGGNDLLSFRDAHVLIVEDAITTAGSVRKVKEVLEIYGADVYAVCALLSRGTASARDLGVCELVTLVQTDFEMTDVRRLLAS